MKCISAHALEFLAIGCLSLALLSVYSHAVDLDPELTKEAKEFDSELARQPALSPEECAKQSPDRMYERLEEANGRLPPEDPGRVNGISSLAGEDQFDLVYAHQLRLKTDHDYPKFKAFREPLLKSFQLCMEYIAMLYHNTPVRHENSRVPGRVEWILYQAGHTDFLYVEKSDWEPDVDYEPELIERIGLAMGRAMVNPTHFPFDTEMRPILKKCLASLAEAERYMTEPQKQFFRRRLALFMTRYM